jgi:hypothetical protein
LAAKEPAEEKASVEKYKKEYSEYWKDILGTDFNDVKFTEEQDV